MQSNEPAFYLYRRGDGNEGNFPRAVVEILPGADLATALAALVINDYISGGSRRRWIKANLEADGDDTSAHAEIISGPGKESALNGGAWLTAELEPLTAEDASYYRGQSYTFWPAPVRDKLDKGARAILDKAALSEPQPAAPPSPCRWIMAHSSLGASGSATFRSWSEARHWAEERARERGRVAYLPLAVPDGDGADEGFTWQRVAGSETVSES